MDMVHAVSEQGATQPYTETISLPSFILKLWKILEEGNHNDSIFWDESGFSFHIVDPFKFSSDVLPRYFKHNQLNSFVRQLNMYGFNKVVNLDKGSIMTSNDHAIEFRHPYFVHGCPQLLTEIKRKQSSSVGGHQDLDVVARSFSGSTPEACQLLTEVRNMKQHQLQMDKQLQQLQRTNQVLWQELAMSRQMHQKQQDIVNKLIRFLLSSMESSSAGTSSDTQPVFTFSPNKRRLMMIPSSSEGDGPAKAPKLKLISSNDNNQGPSTSGPMLREVVVTTPSVEKEKKFRIDNSNTKIGPRISLNTNGNSANSTNQQLPVISIAPLQPQQPVASAKINTMGLIPNAANLDQSAASGRFPAVQAPIVQIPIRLVSGTDGKILAIVSQPNASDAQPRAPSGPTVPVFAPSTVVGTGKVAETTPIISSPSEPGRSTPSVPFPSGTGTTQAVVSPQQQYTVLSPPSENDQNNDDNCQQAGNEFDTLSARDNNLINEFLVPAAQTPFIGAGSIPTPDYRRPNSNFLSNQGTLDSTLGPDFTGQDLNTFVDVVGSDLDELRKMFEQGVPTFGSQDINTVNGHSRMQPNIINGHEIQLYNQPKNPITGEALTSPDCTDDSIMLANSNPILSREDEFAAAAVNELFPSLETPPVSVHRRPTFMG